MPVPQRGTTNTRKIARLIVECNLSGPFRARRQCLPPFTQGVALGCLVRPLLGPLSGVSPVTGNPDDWAVLCHHSIPHVALIKFDLVTAEKLAEFVVKGAGPMMLLLRGDVVADSRRV